MPQHNAYLLSRSTSWHRKGAYAGQATYYASNSRSSIAFKIFTGGIASNDFTADMCMDETERDGACGDRGLDTSALDEGN